MYKRQGVGAAGELAVVQVGDHLPKGVGQLVLEDLLLPVQLHVGKAGGVGQIAAKGQGVELHLAGGVPPPAQLVADLPGLDLGGEPQVVDEGGLAHPRDVYKRQG